MKYIKLFENYKDIEDICSYYNINNYIINKDNTINVDGNVILNSVNITNIPLNFSEVSGKFSCLLNRLTSLKGSPLIVGNSYLMGGNLLSNLDYFPKYVGSIISVATNKLSSLKGCIKYINDELFIANNNLYSLIGIIKVNSSVSYFGNPVEELMDVFDGVSIYLECLNDFNFHKPNSNIIYQTRFIEALKEIGISDLPFLKNYIYV